MAMIKYPKFVQVGQDSIAVAGTTTHIAFMVCPAGNTIQFDDIPVVVATPNTLTTIMVDNKTTAGFDVAVAAACTVHWHAIYSCLCCTGNDSRADYYPHG